MISLKKTIEAYDFRSMWQAALESYRAAIQSLETHALGVDHPGIAQYRANLLAFKNRFENVNLGAIELRELATELDAELKKYRTDLEALLKESNHDVKDLVAVLAEATESLSQRENLYSGQLARISGSLEAISQIDNLGQMRVSLNRQVTELRSCISRMSQDNESVVASLQQEIATFQQKLEKVQVEASTDPLTGLANRRKCLREISSRVRSRARFGIILFDLNKFKNVNDTLGHGAGDSVLKVIGQRLAAQVRQNDMVCRWGGDEFVVVQEGSAEELASRGKEIAARISGCFAIRLNGADHNICIGTEFGWAEYRPNETPEELFSRADQELYKTKSPQSKPDQPALCDPPISTAEDAKADPPPPTDTTTGLRKVDSVEEIIAQIEGDPTSWFLSCFAVRAASKVNNHYGFPATDIVLPFLRDQISESKFGSNLFRARGAAILALVHCPEGAKPLEEELARICRIGLEKFLQQKRRASILPIAVAGKLVAVAGAKAVQEITAFIDSHRSPEQKVPALSSARGM